MPRGQYKRTKEIIEKCSGKKIGKLNPNYLNGKYCGQNITDKKMEKARKAKLINLANLAKKTYLDKEWIFNKYCIEECSIQHIAELCKVDYSTIWFGFDNLGIPKISDIGKRKWHQWVEKTKTLKPFKYADLRTL